MAINDLRCFWLAVLFVGFVPSFAHAVDLNPPVPVSVPGSMAGDPAISVDAGGNVRVAFLEGEELRFATGPGFTPGGFLVVGGAGDRDHPSLHTSASGVSTIVYAQDGNVWQLANPGGPFGMPVPIAQHPAPEKLPVVAGPIGGGALDVLWMRETVGGDLLVHRRGVQPEVLLDVADEFSVAHDGSVLHLTYTRGGDVFYRVRSVGGWGGELAVTSGNPIDAAPAIAASTGVVHLAFTRGGNLFYTRSIAAGAFTVPVNLTSAAPGVQSPRLLLGGGGSVMIIYRAGGDLFRVVGVGALFTTPTNLTQTPLVDEADFQAALDVLGHVHLAICVGGDLQYRNSVPPPTADFMAQPASGEAPLLVDFLGLTTGIVGTWHWNFGDGTASMEASPTHLYAAPGTYDVTLTVAGPGGTASLLRAGLITVTSPQSHLWIPAVTVFPGEANVHLPVHASHVEPLQGFQVAITWDCAKIAVSGMEVVGTDMEILLPEFIGTQLSNDPQDCYLTVGLLIDVNPPVNNRVLPPGQNHRLMNLILAVSPTAVPGSTTVDLQSGVGSPPIQNVFTIGGISVPPQLVDGQLTIVDTAGAANVFRRGDVSGNGTVNLPDAVILLNYLFASGHGFACLDQADVNDSGAIDLADPIYLLSFLFGTGLVLPYPFPGQGLDPTPDALGDC